MPTRNAEGGRDEHPETYSVPLPRQTWLTLRAFATAAGISPAEACLLALHQVLGVWLLSTEGRTTPRQETERGED